MSSVEKLTAYAPSTAKVRMPAYRYGRGICSTFTHSPASGRFSTMSSTLPMYRLAISAQTRSPWFWKSWGPGWMPYDWKAVMMMAAVAVVGRPRVSSGTSTPAAAALLAASGPATPSIAPRPNCSLFFDSFFSLAYDRKVATSAPPAGMVPMGKPMKVPRSHGFHERRQSSRVIQLRQPRVTGMTGMGPCRRRAATYSVSPTANRPTATSTTLTPSDSARIPIVYRA